MQIFLTNIFRRLHLLQLELPGDAEVEPEEVVHPGHEAGGDLGHELWHEAVQQQVVFAEMIRVMFVLRMPGILLCFLQNPMKVS